MKSWPLPVADMLRRVQFASNGNAAHEAAWLLFEVMVKLCAAAQLGVYLGQPGRCPKVRAFLTRALDAPSVGTWNTLLQLVSAALVDVPSADKLPLSGTFSRLTRPRPMRGVSAFLEFWHRIRDGSDDPGRSGAVGGTPAGRPRDVAVSAFFAELCAYRNHEIGHKGLRSEEHYAGAARLLTEALVEAWSLSRPLADFQLGLVRLERDPRSGPSRPRCDILHGDLSRSPFDAGSLPPGALERLPEGTPVLAGHDVLVPLPPLLVCEPNEQDLPVVALLNGIDRSKSTRDVRGASYLVHHSGRRIQRSGAEVREFLHLFDALDRPAAAAEPPTAIAAGQGPGMPAGAVGRFTLLREAGRGPAGLVFQSRHADILSEVAVKVFPVPDETARERLLRTLEAVKATGGGGPHLVRVLEVGSDGGVVYLVREWVEGGSLAERLRDLRPDQRLAESALLDLAAAAVAGLESLHAAGAMHGNLKPENVLLPADWEQAPLQFQNARLADAGLARLPTTAGRAASPPAPEPYRAPECGAGAAAGDQRSDLYSLGAVLFHAAAGTAPPGHDPAALAGVLSDRRPDLSRGLADVILQLLCPDPSGRFRRAAAAGAALRAVAGAALPPAGQATPARETPLEAALRISEQGVRMIAMLKGQK
jgi:hypothetical protein